LGGFFLLAAAAALTPPVSTALFLVCAMGVDSIVFCTAIYSTAVQR
jgi:hypothetical protein